MIARVSHLEAFRKFQLEEDWPLENFLRQVTGDESTAQQRVGTAFHKALQFASIGEHETFSVDGYTFILDASLGEIELPFLKEMRLARQYGDLTVSGQVDGIDGLTVTDYKTTGSFDADRYLESYQWRLYLDIASCTRFRYLIFEIDIPYERDVHDEKVYLEFDPIHIKRLHKLECFSYPQLHEDCSLLASSYESFFNQFQKGNLYESATR